MDVSELLHKAGTPTDVPNVEGGEKSAAPARPPGPYTSTPLPPAQMTDPSATHDLSPGSQRVFKFVGTKRGNPPALSHAHQASLVHGTGTAGATPSDPAALKKPKKRTKKVPAAGSTSSTPAGDSSVKQEAVTTTVKRAGRRKLAAAAPTQAWKVVGANLGPLKKAGSSGEGVVCRPRIWASGKTELFAALPILGPSKCVSGVSWTHTKTPMVLLEDEAERCVEMISLSAHQGFENHFELILARTLVPTSAGTKASLAPAYQPLTQEPVFNYGPTTTIPAPIPPPPPSSTYEKRVRFMSEGEQRQAAPQGFDSLYTVEPVPLGRPTDAPPIAVLASGSQTSPPTMQSLISDARQSNVEGIRKLAERMARTGHEPAPLPVNGEPSAGSASKPIVVESVGTATNPGGGSDEDPALAIRRLLSAGGQRPVEGDPVDRLKKLMDEMRESGERLERLFGVNTGASANASASGAQANATDGKAERPRGGASFMNEESVDEDMEVSQQLLLATPSSPLVIPSLANASKQNNTTVLEEPPSPTLSTYSSLIDISSPPPSPPPVLQEPTQPDPAAAHHTQVSSSLWRSKTLLPCGCGQNWAYADCEIHGARATGRAVSEDPEDRVGAWAEAPRGTPMSASAVGTVDHGELGSGEDMGTGRRVSQRKRKAPVEPAVKVQVPSRKRAKRATGSAKVGASVSVSAVRRGRAGDAVGAAEDSGMAMGETVGERQAEKGVERKEKEKGKQKQKDKEEMPIQAILGVGVRVIATNGSGSNDARKDADTKRPPWVAHVSAIAGPSTKSAAFSPVETPTAPSISTLTTNPVEEKGTKRPREEKEKVKEKRPRAPKAEAESASAPRKKQRQKKDDETSGAEKQAKHQGRPKEVSRWAGQHVGGGIGAQHYRMLDGSLAPPSNVPIPTAPLPGPVAASYPSSAPAQPVVAAAKAPKPPKVPVVVSSYGSACGTSGMPPPPPPASTPLLRSSPMVGAIPPDAPATTNSFPVAVTVPKHPQLPSLPAEVRTLIDAYVSGSPIAIVATRARMLEVLPPARDGKQVEVPKECGVGWLGLFRICAVDEKCTNMFAGEPLSVQWSFRVEWVPGGEKHILDPTSGLDFTRPWWSPKPVEPETQPEAEAEPAAQLKQPEPAQTEPPAPQAVSKLPPPPWELSARAQGKKPAFAPSASSSSGNSSEASHTVAFDRDADPTPPIYLLARQANPSFNYTETQTRSLAAASELVPEGLLGEFNIFISNEFFPSGWLCRKCGRVNFQVAMRRRRCGGSRCMKDKDAQVVSYAQELEDMRGVFANSPCCVPFNEYARDVLGTTISWNTGMSTLSYYFPVDGATSGSSSTAASSLLPSSNAIASTSQSNPNGPSAYANASASSDGATPVVVVGEGNELERRKTKVWIKHVFTGNIAQLQVMATELLRDVQKNVDLFRDVRDPSSPFFEYCSDLPVDGANGMGDGGVPRCLVKAGEFITKRAVLYAEVPKEKMVVSAVEVLAWLVAGGRKGQDIMRAKHSPMAVMCLGSDVVMCLSPQSKKVVEGGSFTLKKQKSAGAAASTSGAKQMKGKAAMNRQVDGDDVSGLLSVDQGIDEDESMEDATQEDFAGEGNLPSSSRAPAAAKLAEGTVQITMVHGDVLVLSGDDFAYSLKRSGTGILIFGVKAGS